MFTNYSSRLQTLPLLSLTKCKFKMRNSRSRYPFCNTCRNFCHSSPQLSEDAISHFKNRHLGKFVNNLISENISPSIPNFSFSAAKKANLSNLIEQFNTSKNNITSLKDLQKDAKDDADFFKSVQGELMSLENSLNEVEEAILNELLSNEDESVSDVVVEVSAGVGGQEAMLFAGELNAMYYNYFNFRGWQVELTNQEETSIGGMRHSMMLISGKNSFKTLSIEGGVHRVQRIPATEKGSRLHTSTVTVTVYPQPSEVDIVIPESDIKFETKNASGPGGQHVNKIQTAVRIYHLPSGIIVECQTSKSQTQNRKVAMQKLRSKLFQIECEKRDSKVESARKFQMGLRGRNEKIRTYNFPQDRITDHRFHVSCNNLQKYFEGNSYYHNFLEQLHGAQIQKRKEEFLRVVRTAT